MNSCTSNDECGRSNYCDLDSNKCVHDDMFPVSGFDIFLYILSGALLGVANIGGLVSN